MAIFGAGSNWDNEEQKDSFFKEGNFVLGWDDKNANDLYAIIASLKVGDIIYLKSNKPGSKIINVKGIGIVTKTVLQCLDRAKDIHDWYSLCLKVKWVCKNDFPIQIGKNEGKLTNVRAASFYEEFLPSVQTKIIDKLLK
jgi:hypothetical protein